VVRATVEGVIERRRRQWLHEELIREMKSGQR
jgi:hypothetical protein